MVTPPHAKDHALATAVEGLERRAAHAGWDQATRVFALVHPREAAAADPDFRAQLIGDDPATLPEAHLTPVEQTELPETETVEELLGRIAWPDSVAGAAIILERVILPGDDEGATTESVLASPDRIDVRVCAGALRDGTGWSVLRFRSQDDPELRPQGPDLVPALLEQLTSTFRPLTS